MKNENLDFMSIAKSGLAQTQHKNAALSEQPYQNNHVNQPQLPSLAFCCLQYQTVKEETPISELMPEHF